MIMLRALEASGRHWESGTYGNEIIGLPMIYCTVPDEGLQCCETAYETRYFQLTELHTWV